MNEHCCEHCTNTSEDHDILIEIRTNLKNFTVVSADHEVRIRRTERWGLLAIGGLTVIDLIVMFVLGLLGGKH